MKMLRPSGYLIHFLVLLLIHLVQRYVSPHASHGGQEMPRALWRETMRALRPTPEVLRRAHEMHVLPWLQVILHIRCPYEALAFACVQSFYTQYVFRNSKPGAPTQIT